MASCEDKVDSPLSGTLTGNVTTVDESTPLEEVKITTNPFTETVETDSLGNFIFSDIETGEYTVIATLSGYRSASVDAMVEFGDTMDIEIFMEKRYSTDDIPEFSNEFYPAENETVNDINVTFSWQVEPNSNEDTTYFDLILYESGAQANSRKFENVTDTFQLVQDLKFETFYYWQLVGKNSAGEVYSPVRQFKTLSFPRNQILFSRGINNTSQLFISDTLSDAFPVQITHAQHHSWNAKINPQRTTIVFESSMDIYPALFAMDIDGSSLRKITTFNINGLYHRNIEFDWNPNGSEIVFTSFDKLYRVNPNGTGLTLLATAPENYDFREVAYAPDGNTIFLMTVGDESNDRQIYSVNPNGENLQLIYNNNQYALSGLDVHPDNVHLLFSVDISGFISDSGRMLDASLHEYNINTQEIMNLSNSKPDGTNDLKGIYSPDGGRIVFVNSLNTIDSEPSIFMYDSQSEFLDDRRKLLFEGASYPFWYN